MRVWDGNAGKWKEIGDNELKQINKKNITRKNKQTNKNYFEDGYQFGDVSKTIVQAGKNIVKTPENFKDGYQFGDVTKTALGTTADVGLGVVKGIANFGESIGDLINFGLAAGIKGVGKLTNNQGLQNFADIYREEAANDEVVNTFFGKLDKITDKTTAAGSTTDALSSGIGNVLAMANGGMLLPKGAQALKVGKFAMPTTAIVSGTGSGMAEAYRNDATDGEALKYGLMSGFGEAFSESLFGGLGTKFTKVYGVGGLDDVIIKKITDNISNRALRILSESGFKAIGEGTEEVISGFSSAIAKKLTYLDDEEFDKILRDEDLLNQFIMGTLTSIVSQTPGTIQSVSQGRDYITGKTSFDEAMDVRKKYIENNQALAPLSIQNEVDNTNIPGTQNIQKNGVSWQGFTEQNFNQDGTTTNFANNRANDKEYAPYVPIKGQENLDNNRYQYKQSKNQKVNALNESMAQNNFDNSQSSKDLANVMTKLIEDKGYNILFDSSIKSANGQFVNAQVRDLENGEVEIRINPNSTRAGEFLIMHEITHTLETNEMKQLVLDYASKNNEFNEALMKLENLYGTNDVTSEVLADISGQLFGNQEFINGLSTEKPSLFRKIYNSIISLANKLTGNSKYDLFVKDLKNKWETAYRASNNENIEGNIKFSIENVGNFDQMEYNNINEMALPKKEYGKLAHIVDSTSDITSGINEVILSDKIYLIYYKGYNDFKVLKSYDTIDYYGEVDENGINENANKSNKRIETTRSRQNDSQFSDVRVENRETTTNNDGLSNINQERNNKQKQSYIEGNRNREELLDSSFFSTKNKASKQYLEKQFKELTGDSIMKADAVLGGIAFRNNMREAGNRTDAIENTPYSDEAMKIYKTYKNSRKSSNALYHTTARKNLQSILEKGLTTNNQARQEGVSGKGKLYVAANEELASSFGEDTDILFRINPNYNLENLEYDLLGGEGTYSTTDNIPVSALQVKENGKWVRLENSQLAKENIKYSLSEDNQGRKLTKEQQEYFKNSKVRDENGNLRVLYNGSGEHTIYDPAYMSDESKWGKGIYLTPYKDVAEQYGSNVKEAYVNIKNPLVPGKSITFEQYNNLYKAINDGEEAYREEYDMYDDDLDLLWDITNKGNWADYADEIIKYTGKDGIIVDDPEFEKADIMVIAFKSNQIKNIDNTNPTSDADIRYSLSEETSQDDTDKLREILLEARNGLDDNQIRVMRKQIAKKNPNFFNKATDNLGRKLSDGMQDYMKNSQARDINDSLTTVYHTMTDDGAQFNEFNPVGTKYYRFGEQVVNYYTDSKDMSGSYAGQDYQMADTKKLNNIEELNDYLDKITKQTGNTYTTTKQNGLYIVSQDKQISKEAREFINALNDNEKQQMLDNIWEDEEDLGNYSKVFSWTGFDKELNNKYHEAINKYMGTADLVAIQQEMMKYLEAPALLHEDTRLNGEVVGAYDTEAEMLKNIKTDLQKSNWSKNTKMQYEGYVNITNPYIVDAEGKNWDSVSQKIDENIEKEYKKIVTNNEIKNELIKLYKKSQERYIEYINSNDYKYDKYLYEKFNSLPSKVQEAMITADLVGEKYTDFIKEWDNSLSTDNIRVEGFQKPELTIDDFARMVMTARENINNYGKPSSYFENEYENITGVLQNISGDKLSLLASINFEEMGLGIGNLSPIDILGEKHSTNDIVKQVIEMNKNGANYDGVIIKNTYDYGGRANVEHTANNLYVTFNSNQFKSWNNENPTDDSDIRYSLSEDGKNNKTLNPLEISKLIPEDANTTPKTKNIKVSSGEGNSKFVDNLLDKTDMLSFESKNAILKDSDVKYYEEVTNKESLEKAFKRLNENGNAEVMSWMGKNPEVATSVDIAEGWILMKQYQDAIEKTDSISEKESLNRSMVQVAKKMREMGTKAGQTVQAFNIMNRLTPEGMVYFAQSELEEAYNQMVKGKTKGWIDKYKSDFELSPSETKFIMDTMQEIMNMKDGYDKRVKLAQIQKLMTDKLPPERGAGMKAWMRMSMLFNPKTQVRNILGNAVIAPVNSVSDFISGKVDKAVASVTGVRTTGSTNMKSYAKGFKTGMYQSYNDFRLGINTRNIEGNRFEISTGKSFKDQSKIGKRLNQIDSFLSFMLDAGDRGFYEAAFTNSINNQLVLNNTTKVTQDMIDIATTEALQRTWQDNNGYTRFVLNIRKGLNTINVKGYGLGDVLIPFAKTPANLTKAIVDYSPVGMVKAIVEGNNLKNAIKTGQFTPQQQHKFVQDLGKGVAGTLLYVLGYALAQAGITTGESDEDKDVANFMKNTLGVSSYSIKIGNKTFTYDWAQPIAAPLAIMANYSEKQKENSDASAVENLVSSLDVAGNILLEQSFMESINTVLNNRNGIATGIQEAIVELPSRAIPTLFKQIVDLTDSTQRQSFVYDKPLESAINKVKAKIPGASYALAPVVDTMGREVKKYGGKNNIFNVLFNPANVNTENISKSAEEIYKLYKETGNGSIMPKVTPYYINSKGEKVVLTNEQRSEFQKVSGKLIEDEVKKLLNSNDYKYMSSEDKAKIIEDLVNYSYNKAKYEILDMEMSTAYQKAHKYELNGGNVSDYYTFTNSVDDTNSETKKASVLNYLVNSSLNDEEIAELYTKYYSSEETVGLIKTLGISMKEFIKLDSQNFESDYNSKGKAISGSKQKKLFNYINSLKLSSVQKAALMKTQYSSYKAADKQILNYINKQNISKYEKCIIAKQLGFNNYDNYIINYIMNLQALTQDEKLKKLEQLGFNVRNGRVYN